MFFPTLFHLLRVKQWYKNIIIFIALVFSLNLFNIPLALKFIIGFISLCFVSSSSYIINDIIDRKEDRFHPEKKLRPIAAGTIRVPLALVLSALLFFFALVLSFFLSPYFLLVIVLLFANTQLYTFFFKNEIFLDVIAIALNFVLRAMAGILLVTTQRVSPWIFLSTFFLAIMIALGKRKAELHRLQGLSEKHKSVLRQYQHVPLDLLIFVSITFILVFYAIYSIFEGRDLLVLTIPIAFYALARYVSFSSSQLDILGNPERIFRDRRMLISIIIWFLVVVLVLYS